MSRSFLFNFTAAFAKAVELGQKMQTIRATRADGRVPRPGDIAKCYTGLRTGKARLLIAAPVVSCVPVTMDLRRGVPLLILNGEPLLRPHLAPFAVADGFKDPVEMFDWFRKQYGFEFEGFCVKWQPPGA